MAILIPTPATVVPGTGARYIDATAGEALLQGAACYLAPDNTALLAVATADPPAGANVRGLAVNVAATGQPVRLQMAGDLTFDGTSEGVLYVLSATLGALAPAADLAATHRVVLVGVGLAGGGLRLHLYNSGVVVPGP